MKSMRSASWPRSRPIRSWPRKWAPRYTLATCNFDYAAALTEPVLLGNVAYRLGQKLQWDARAVKATNCPEADRLIRRQYREGWRL
jgi:hypothetical protein